MKKLLSLLALSGASIILIEYLDRQRKRQGKNTIEYEAKKAITDLKEKIEVKKSEMEKEEDKIPPCCTFVQDEKASPLDELENISKDIDSSATKKPRRKKKENG